MKSASISLALMLALSGTVHAESVNRAANTRDFVGKLFTGVEQYSNFYRMEALFPSELVQKSSQSVEWPSGPVVELPKEYSFEGRRHLTGNLLKDTDTSALLVIKNGQIRYEQYWLTGGKQQHWTSMSVAKSFVSALYGIAVAEGTIHSIEDPASKYLQALKGSAYDGVSLKDILQMSSGVRWDEDYSNPNSDVARLGGVMASGSSLLNFVRTLKNERQPGTFNHYCSADTLVLGLVLEAATGQSLAAYMQKKLWQPLGSTDDGYWLKDNYGHTLTFGGYNATARDYARLGELYRLNGKFNGQQIVPAGWIKDSLTPDAPYLMPGKRNNSDSTMGYGYQWWLPEGQEHDYSAIGIFNQFIYVSPDQQTVIVKLSASRNYAKADKESSWREKETIELFRQIAKSID
ncbi:serine hydrolase domain-containing protein [Pseudomonas gingeri]|uniref:serine hydrolase domain-containing protein n=1 Tax=Pseudomonas gingeri TaxID=117681 RepID=UPI00159FAEF3|nr:serine hydrolase [Pseudomonas gingeri]NWA11648.1 serine hydrolase [Pseudomonas gingeri]